MNLGGHVDLVSKNPGIYLTPNRHNVDFVSKKCSICLTPNRHKAIFGGGYNLFMEELLCFLGVSMNSIS